MINAICFRCGAGKDDAMSPCRACSARPVLDEEVAMSLFLSTKFMTPDRLGPASRLLQAGQPVTIPARLRPLLILAVRDVRPKSNATQPTTQRLSSGLTARKIASAVAGVIVLLALWLHPWPQYQLAKFRNSEAGYDGFVKRHPASAWTPAANKTLRKMREDSVWAAAANSDDVKPVREYLKIYADGKYVTDARAAIERLAQAKWFSIAFTASEEEIRTFLRDFAGTAPVPDARRRLEEVREEQAWLAVLRSADLIQVRDYIRHNPQSRFLKDAQAQLVDLSKKKWAARARSASETELNGLIREFADTPLAEYAERRLHEFYFDLQWLSAKRSIAAYREHLRLYPDSPYRAEVEKRIIDLEVAEIMANNPGALPPSTLVAPANAYGSTAEISIQNNTGYELTVRYSGNESRRIIIPVNGSQTIQLQSGSYKVAASVDAVRVRNYAGTENIQPARYQNQFYIDSSTYPSFSIPTAPIRRGIR